ncbi:MAG: ABC transporter substrate-binding protein [Anaerovoracaceae bacterium]|jgi:iron complex transport system substrate-binding protein
MKKITAFTALILSAVLAFTGCGSAVSGSSSSDSGQTENENTRTITNIDGSQIEVPEEAQRIAAVYGPSYEACVALGAEDKVVVDADVQFENFPWAEKIFKNISSNPYLENVHSSVSFEELQKYNPDLVLTFNRPNELSQLKKAGIAAVNGVTTKNLDEVKELLKVYAEAIGGDAPSRADAYAEYFDRKLQMITDKTSTLGDSEKPTVYYAGVDILTTYGNKSDIIEAIEAAGGNPVMKDLDAGNHTSIDFEQLAVWNPQYIFIDHGGMSDKKTVEQIMEDAENDSRYAAIDAVKNDQMYLVPSGTFYWDMGIQKILLIEYMAKILHPDLFQDLDMAAELQEFYSEFFSYDLTDEEAQKILDREDP